MITSKARKTKRRSEWGSVRQLRSGNWQVRFRDPKGVLRNDSRTYATEQAARARLVQLRAQLTSGAPATTPSKQERSGSTSSPTSGSRTAGSRAAR